MKSYRFRIDAVPVVVASFLAGAQFRIVFTNRHTLSGAFAWVFLAIAMTLIAFGMGYVARRHHWISSMGTVVGYLASKWVFDVGAFNGLPRGSGPPPYFPGLEFYHKSIPIIFFLVQ
jgi:hypothetical protein